ncbi:MAG: hypothetical protein ABIJ46_02225 [bacterium]
MEKGFDSAAAKAFLSKEFGQLTATNRRAAEARSISASRRDVGRTPLVVVCMDERNPLTEDGLGLDPTLVVRFASGGGKVAAGDFLRLHAPLLADGGRKAVIYLCTHWVQGEPENGCAAFQCDEPAQTQYFTALRQALAAELPEAWIHALSYDTATGALYGIELDLRDETFVALVGQGSRPLAMPREEHAHAGFGIYVGDFYRAWISGYNRYFHISAGAPSLRDDLDIALSVMLHHSTVDLSDKPIVLLLDRPTENADAATIERHRQAKDAVMEFLRSPEVAPLVESGRLRLVELETDPTTWSGRILTVLN